MFSGTPGREAVQVAWASSPLFCPQIKARAIVLSACDCADCDLPKENIKISNERQGTLSWKKIHILTWSTDFMC